METSELFEGKKLLCRSSIIFNYNSVIKFLFSVFFLREKTKTKNEKCFSLSPAEQMMTIIIKWAD